MSKGPILGQRDDAKVIVVTTCINVLVYHHFSTVIVATHVSCLERVVTHGPFFHGFAQAKRILHQASERNPMASKYLLLKNAQSLYPLRDLDNKDT